MIGFIGVGIYAITNLVWREMFSHKLYIRSGRQGLNYRSEKGIEKFLKRNRSNHEIAKYVKGQYNSYTAAQKKLFVKNFREKIHKNTNLKRYVERIEKHTNNITSKLFRGVKLTLHEKNFIKDYGLFLMPEEYQNDDMKGLNSKYLLAGRYNAQYKVLGLWMIRGKDMYKFYNVPQEVWIHLTTLKENAGSYWNTQWLKHALNSRYTRR